MGDLIRKLARHDDGQDVIEYALLAAGISIAAILTVPDIGASLVGVYNNVLAVVTDLVI
ncbi:MAG: Flp family type IVb pilin [Acidobacteria bacterium]|nr:Flp family type IVb pilin [Acidobacteriota bacterium]